MEKILVIQNCHSIDKASLSFACYVAKLSASKLTVLLFQNEEIEYAAPGTSIYARPAGSHSVVDTSVMPVEKAKAAIVEECRQNSVPVEIMTDENDPVENAVFESYYADILVISAGFSLWEKKTDIPSSLIRHLLAKSQCPVFLTPPTFCQPEEIVFCYDGSPSSLFAIKQFAYLFPRLREIRCTIVEVNDSITCSKIVSHTRLLGWLNGHFNKVGFHYLHGNVTEELTGYFREKKNAMIVMGAYGRGFISTLIKKSASDDVIQGIELPLFIAHH